MSADDRDAGRARVVVVEGSSGREVLRRSFDGSGEAPGVAIRGDELYALVPATAGAGVSSVRVVRVGLASGRNVWTSPALSGSLEELPTRLVVDGDAVYAFASEILYALARGTGRIAWRRGLESGSVVSFARPVERGPATLYVATGGRLAEFERGGRAEAERVVVLSGVVTLNGVPVAGAHVRAGPTHVRTGANGRYRLRIRGRGIVNVTVEYLPPRGMEAAGGIEIDLDTSPPRRTEELALVQHEPGL